MWVPVCMKRHLKSEMIEKSKLSYQQRSIKYSVAGFLSLKERALHDKVSEVPGPGAYVNPQTGLPTSKIEAKPNNIFVTKVPRFCPTAPGSTIFKYPSSIYNPGPGTYYQGFKWNDVGELERTRQAYNANKHNDLVIKPQSRAPSIPSKKVPQNAYSGLGFDTVGPAAYNPKEDRTKVRAQEPDFQSSKIQRKIFEPNKTRENNLPSTANPGPGQYDYQNPDDKKNFNAQGQNAIFLSKVPNCKDSKIKTFENLGPGVYEKEMGSTLLSDRHKRSNSETGLNDSQMNSSQMGGGQKNNNFLSTTKREKDFWINRIETPYTHPTSLVNPGPGKYNHEKKKDDIKSRLLVEETVHVPFGSSEERTCMKKQQVKQAVPGPGTSVQAGYYGFRKSIYDS